MDAREPREVVAVDVEVYDRYGGGGAGRDGASSAPASSLGRIARRVPRFATLELDDDYDVSADVRSLRERVGDVLDNLKKGADSGASAEVGGNDLADGTSAGMLSWRQRWTIRKPALAVRWSSYLHRLS